MKTYAVVIASAAALGGVLFGFDTAVIAGTLSPLRHYFNLGDAAMGFLVAASSLGCIPGAFLSGALSNRYGRKKMMLVTAALFVLTSVACGVAGSMGQLAAYRFIGGIAIGMASALAPVYISEISPAAYRGRLGMLQQLAIVAGILLAFVSNYCIANTGNHFITPENQWRYMLAAALIPSVLFFLLLLLIPESPRWLMARGRAAEAVKVFEKIYGEGDEVRGVLESIRQEIIETGPGKIKFAAIFSPRYKRVVIIGIVFASIAQLTGINIIFYYAPLVFEKTHMGGSILFETILTGVVNLVFTLIAFTLIDRLGRKKLLLGGSVLMALCMLFIGGLFYADKTDNYWVLGAIFVYIAAFACTWGAVLWVYVAEIFPNRIRDHATSFAIFGNWTLNAIVSLSFPVMLSGLGAANTFLIYGLVNLGMIFLIQRYITETKGIPLEEMERKMSGPGL